MSIQKFFDSMENKCEPVKFEPETGNLANSTAFFSWSQHGRGFGNIYFYFNDEGELHCDNECMSKERIKEILGYMVDQAVFDDEEKS